jgi:hypothetical protein
MASCRRMTLRERVAAAEKDAGGSISKETRRAIELSLVPAPYVCSGAKVGTLAGTKPGRIKRKRSRVT